MKIKFKKGATLYKTEFWANACPNRPVKYGTLEEDFTCKAPEKDYTITIAGASEIAVSDETLVFYKKITTETNEEISLYLKYGDREITTIEKIKDSYNWLTSPWGYKETNKLLAGGASYKKTNSFFWKCQYTSIGPNSKEQTVPTKLTTIIILAVVIFAYVYLRKKFPKFRKGFWISIGSIAAIFAAYMGYHALKNKKNSKVNAA